MVLGSPDSISGYGGQRLKVKGACRLTCRYKEKTVMLDIDIVDLLFWARACLDLNIVKLVHKIQTQPETHTSIIEEFADMFKGIGLFPGECVLHLKPSATPVVCPPRRILYALHGKLKDELNEIEKKWTLSKR